MMHATVGLVLFSVGWMTQEPLENAPEFSLQDPRSGIRVTLSEWTRDRPVVIIFLGAQCPVSRRYAPRLREMHASYEGEVTFLGVNSNAQDSDAEIVRFADEYAIPFPIVKDSGSVVAGGFGIERTPTAVLVDQARRIRYRGRIDDKFNLEFDRPEATRLDLRIAIAELLAGNAVSEASTFVSGCRIGRQARSDGEEDVTWNNRIAAIFRDSCHECHRVGKIAPFPLIRYSDVEGWGNSILEEVEARRMPPMRVDAFGHELTKSAPLTDADIQAVRSWVEHGCPEGSQTQAAPSPVYATTWSMLRPPDTVVEIDPAGYVVPDEGPPEYRYYVVEPDLIEGVWIQGAQILPGQPLAVRQAAVYVLMPDVNFNPDRLADSAIHSNLLCWYGPGTTPMEYPEDAAKYIPARSRLLVQVFYRPFGRKVEDRTSIGLCFADPSVKYRTVRTIPIMKKDLVIPADKSSFEATSEQTLTEAYDVLNVIPRLNLRGQRFRFTTSKANREVATLLEVPKYSFYWQGDYCFRDPVPLDAGTVVRCEASYDNSDANPVNPNPSSEVTAGGRITDELLVGYLEVVPRRIAYSDSASSLILADPTQRISLAIGGLAATTVMCLVLLWLKPAPPPPGIKEPAPANDSVAGTP